MIKHSIPANRTTYPPRVLFPIDHRGQTEFQAFKRVVHDASPAISRLNRKDWSKPYQSKVPVSDYRSPSQGD
ncbi:hypothetical protein FA13DRAFT_1730792 [Coprinellus micaceus]|uniref:Uncharacterized protein n=1 Tax=Coprinellus micaceus TaxID=71717 RepID=A0A4Y7TFU3_COPMI|nr:hypothetical protein FA13DRAFT_1730792 [Coprinellus micaceus]